jgi:hypothetical protein
MQVKAQPAAGLPCGCLVVVVQVRHTRSDDGSKCLLRHVVKISVAQYNVKAAHTTTKIKQILDQVATTE